MAGGRVKTRREFVRDVALGAAAMALPQPKARLGSDRLRGLMADAARLVEKPAYYRRLIEFCGAWQVNALLVTLTDDQGSAFRFQRHPDLITHTHALSGNEWGDLAAYGRKSGVQVIPVVESFGHAHYITRVARYAELADEAPGRPGYTGLNPVHPATLPLIRDLYGEVAKAFSSRYLHGGCDEVNWGGSDLSRRALERNSRAEIWANYINALHGICSELKKELIVWGDMVVHKEPDILPRLNKGIVVMDWQYYVTEPELPAQTAKQVMAAGLRVMGAPAIISCEWGPRPGEQTLRNLDAYSDAYRSLEDERCLGVIATNWTPTRYLQGSLWDAFAYAAVAMKDGGKAARSTAFRKFVESHYGAEWSDLWQRVFEIYYAITPNKHCTREWEGPRLPVPWASDEELLKTLSSMPIDPSAYATLAARIRALTGQVTRNRVDLDSFALSAEYLWHILRRNKQLLEAASRQSFVGANAVIMHIADSDEEMVEKLTAEWNAGRYEDEHSQPLYLFGPADTLVYRMQQAAEYSGKLQDDDERLRRLLKISS